MDRQRVDAAGKLPRKRLIDHTMAFDPGLPAERFRHDMDSEMSLPARSGAGVALVLMRFIQNIDALRRKGRNELFGNLCLHQHGT